jgi:hypothetical protein
LWLQTRFPYIFGSRDDNDVSDVDSEPPPLEDYNILEDDVYDDGISEYVMDPIFGSIQRETYLLWKEEEKQREKYRSEMIENYRSKSPVPVRYSSDCS